MICFALGKGEIELWVEERGVVGYKAVVGKYEGLGGWISQVLDDGPSRIEKLAQCLVSRVGSRSPTLLVRLVQHSYLKMPRTVQRSGRNPPVLALWSRVSEPGETEVWVSRRIIRAFSVAAGGVGGGEPLPFHFLPGGGGNEIGPSGGAAAPSGGPVPGLQVLGASSSACVQKRLPAPGLGTAPHTGNSQAWEGWRAPCQP